MCIQVPVNKDISRHEIFLSNGRQGCIAIVKCFPNSVGSLGYGRSHTYVSVASKV